MRTSVVFSVALAFVGGLVVSPWATHWVRSASAQAATQPAAGPALQAMLVDVAALKDSDLAATPNPDQRSRTFVSTRDATLAVQTGNVPRHFHADTDEIQYIVEGTGTIWLGGERREIRPGMLIVIPRGTVHAGSEASSGRFKAIAIKVPPQDPKDTHFVN